MSLGDTNLKNLKPRDTAYKVADRDGLSVVVSPKGTVTFRYNHRLSDAKHLRWDSMMNSRPANRRVT